MKLAAWLLSRREEAEGAGGGSGDGSWRDQLPDNYEVDAKDDKGQPVKTMIPLRGDKMLERYKTIEELARGHIELRKTASASIAKVPGADAKPEERRAFYDKLGVPKDVEGYKVEVPTYEGVTIRDDTMVKVKGLALKHGVLPAALQELTNAVVEDMAGSREQMVKAWRDSHEETIEKEWGENLKANAERARRTFEQFFGGKDGEVGKLLKATGLEYHPGILKGFYELSKHFREHAYIGGDVSGEQTKADIRRKIDTKLVEFSKIESDRDRAKLSREMEGLYRALYGSAEIS